MPRPRVQRILLVQLRSQGLMCLLANRTQSSTRSHPFFPGPSHAVEFQKCLIALFNFKSVFINLFHSFIYFHRQFVIALSKPFDKFLTHSSPYTAIFIDDEVKTIDLLNASPSTTFLCYYNYKLLPRQHTLSVGRQKKIFKTSKWYLWVMCETDVHAIIWAVFLSKIFMKNWGLLSIWKRPIT